MRKFLRIASALCVISVLYLGGNMSALMTSIDLQAKAIDPSIQVPREDPYLAALPMDVTSPERELEQNSYTP